ncbi:TspO/MBR family protein [Sphingomonas sp.]|uniref:TspO/MBR family protein n=1 Tax=Sphingomonas sp. TaxID=28214 RepID=UPI002DD69CEA|nr:TspO/MBR family protein [Sphingomonas sp.]
MSEIASRGQLRMSFLRWAMVTVPLILLLGFASGRLVPSGEENAWYAALVKPALTPPGFVFPVAWTTLYVCLGLALAMIADARGARGRGIAIALFALQFAANLAWTPLFFGAHKVVAAAALIGAMLVLSIGVTFLFARIRKAAAWLMVPYMVWISFAGMLTLGIHQLNPDAEDLVPASSTTQIEI